MYSPTSRRQQAKKKTIIKIINQKAPSFDINYLIGDKLFQFPAENNMKT